MENEKREEIKNNIITNGFIAIAEGDCKNFEEYIKSLDEVFSEDEDFLENLQIWEEIKSNKAELEKLKNAIYKAVKQFNLYHF